MASAAALRTSRRFAAPSLRTRSFAAAGWTIAKASWHSLNVAEDANGVLSSPPPPGCPLVLPSSLGRASSTSRSPSGGSTEIPTRSHPGVIHAEEASRSPSHPPAAAPRTATSGALCEGCSVGSSGTRTKFPPELVHPDLLAKFQASKSPQQSPQQQLQQQRTPALVHPELLKRFMADRNARRSSQQQQPKQQQRHPLQQHQQQQQLQQQALSPGSVSVGGPRFMWSGAPSESERWAEQGGSAGLDEERRTLAAVAAAAASAPVSLHLQLQQQQRQQQKQLQQQPTTCKQRSFGMSTVATGVQQGPLDTTRDADNLSEQMTGGGNHATLGRDGEGCGEEGIVGGELDSTTANASAGSKATAAAAQLEVDDVRTLFSGLSTVELANALLNLELASNEVVVDAASAVLSSPAVQQRRVVGSSALLWGVKKTAHAHFCAGETLEEAGRTLERMWSLGLRGILDFSVEDAVDEETCDRNLQGFLRTIRSTASLPASAVSYACIKITALCPLPILERASTVLRWHHFRNDSPPPSWLHPSLPVLVESSPSYLAGTAPPDPLAAEEIRSLNAALARVREICRECEERGLPLLIDAEYQSVEPAIDHLAYAAALEFNQGKNLPLVYSTVQCYLRDALPRLERSLQEARRMGVAFGVKLVRGAYLSRETEEARAAGAESPVHLSIEDTHECYDACAAAMIRAAAATADSHSSSSSSCSFVPASAVVLATHNYTSGRKAVSYAAEQGLDRGDSRLQFAQLKGMADGLSLALALSGFNVSKYLPYGKVEEVLPYLLRRAQENRGVLGNTRDERRRIRQELSRRVRSAVGF